MSEAAENARDDESLLSLHRYGGDGLSTVSYRPPLTRTPLLDYWLFHGRADGPQVAVLHGEDRLGYRFGLHWLLTAATMERTRVGAITIDGSSLDVERDIAAWSRTYAEATANQALGDCSALALDRLQEGEILHAHRAVNAFVRLCHDDPYRYRDDATRERRAHWERHLVFQQVRRHRYRRTVPLRKPLIRRVSLSAIELLGDPWRRGADWEETVSRPLMLLIATESRDPERLAMLREHAHWVARLTEGFVLLCEPERSNHVNGAAPMDEIRIRLDRNPPVWCPESEEAGEPVYLHARYGGNPRPTFAIEIVDRGNGLFA